jgi:hypothetical protein
MQISAALGQRQPRMKNFLCIWYSSAVE